MTPRKSSKARHQRKAWAVRLANGKLMWRVFLTRDDAREWINTDPVDTGAKGVRVTVTIEEVAK